jgi:hypothetical protein
MAGKNKKRCLLIFYLVCLFGVCIAAGRARYKSLTIPQSISKDNLPAYFLVLGTDKNEQHNLLVIRDYSGILQDEMGLPSRKAKREIQEMLTYINCPGAKALRGSGEGNYRFYIKKGQLDDITVSINKQINNELKKNEDIYKAFGRGSVNKGDYIRVEIAEDDEDERKQKIFLRYKTYETTCDFIYEVDAEKVMLLSYGDTGPDDAPCSRRFGLGVFIAGLGVYFVLFVLPGQILSEIRKIKKAASIERID